MDPYVQKPIGVLYCMIIFLIEDTGSRNMRPVSTNEPMSVFCVKDFGGREAPLEGIKRARRLGAQVRVSSLVHCGESFAQPAPSGVGRPAPAVEVSEGSSIRAVGRRGQSLMNGL